MQWRFGYFLALNLPTNESSLSYETALFFVLQDCEKERKQLRQEEKAKLDDQKRKQRRKLHLERALLTPPPRKY